MQRMIAIGLAIFLGGCLPQAEAPTVSPATSPTAASPEESIASPPPASPAASPTAPRTATLMVEGEPIQVELERYETPQFTADIPKGEFVPTLDSAADGTGVRFNFSPTGTPEEKVYVQVFFPSEPISVAALSEQTTGSGGLLATEGWEAIDRDPTLPYDWARTAIDYEQPNADQIAGTIYVGEHQGKAFLVYTHYPLEYVEGFAPRLGLLLESFEPR